jgi:hypothetical protein
VLRFVSNQCSAGISSLRGLRCRAVGRNATEASASEFDAWPASAAGTNVEFEVPRAFEPCRHLQSAESTYCGSTRRFIRYVPSSSGRKLVCENEHSVQHNGKSFIPAYEFDDGGAFEGTLPEELLPNNARIRQTRWKISNKAEARLSGYSRCALCETQPFDMYANTKTLEAWQWIAQHDKPLLSEIHTELSAAPGIDLREWFGAASVALRQKIIERLSMSTLVIDHGVPRQIANDRWPFLSAAERVFLQEDLLFKLCRRCNGERASDLLPLERLTGMYVDTLYHGSLAAAKADTRRWIHFETVAKLIYRQKLLA